MDHQRYEKVDVRIEAARIACGVLGRSKLDQDTKGGLEQFKEAYEYMKEELEEAISTD